MTFVLDSSVALAWVYSDEIVPDALRVSEMIAQEGAVVPAIWRLEVANSLQMSVRRGRIDGVFRDHALKDLSMLHIEVDVHTDVFAWSTTLSFADRYNLTSYDACYLELARRRGLPLATLDRDLRSAGRNLNIPLL